MHDIVLLKRKVIQIRKKSAAITIEKKEGGRRPEKEKNARPNGTNDCISQKMSWMIEIKKKKRY